MWDYIYQLIASAFQHLQQIYFVNQMLLILALTSLVWIVQLNITTCLQVCIFCFVTFEWSYTFFMSITLKSISRPKSKQILNLKTFDPYISFYIILGATIPMNCKNCGGTYVLPYDTATCNAEPTCPVTNVQPSGTYSKNCLFLNAKCQADGQITATFCQSTLFY